MHYSMLVVLPREQWMFCENPDLEWDRVVNTMLENMFEPYREKYVEGKDPTDERVKFTPCVESNLSYRLYGTGESNEGESFSWEIPFVDAFAAWERAARAGAPPREYTLCQKLIKSTHPDFPVKDMTAWDFIACRNDYDWCEPCEEHPEGAWGYWSNPEGHWDWWVIGGRYANQLPTKPNAVFTSETSSVALRRDVDHNAIVERCQGWMSQSLDGMEPHHENSSYHVPATFDDTLATLGIPAVNQARWNRAKELHQLRDSMSVLRSLLPHVQKYAEAHEVTIDELDAQVFPSLDAFHSHVEKIRHLIDGEMDAEYKKLALLVEEDRRPFPTLYYTKPTLDDLDCEEHTWYYDFASYGLVDSEGWHTWEDDQREKRAAVLTALLEGDPYDLLVLVDFHT